MSERFAIELPSDLSEGEQEELVASLRELEEVDGADVLGGTKGLDPVTISIGVKLATQIGPAIMPAVQKIIDMFRGRQITGVKIIFPGGVQIAVDEISGKDLKQLLELLGK